jgi:hypothetical protein
MNDYLKLVLGWGFLILFFAACVVVQFDVVPHK